jgi:hypothetical protein
MQIEINFWTGVVLTIVPIIITALNYFFKNRLERKKFDYSKKVWREKILIQLTTKLIEDRMKEYDNIWKALSTIGMSNLKNPEFDFGRLKTLAKHIREWRYTSAALLADKSTRTIAYDLQRILWDSTIENFDIPAIINLRNRFRDALVADVGFGTFEGNKNIFESFTNLLDTK